MTNERQAFLKAHATAGRHCTADMLLDALAHIQEQANELANAREQLNTTHDQVAQMCRFLEPKCHAPDAWSLRDLIQKQAAEVERLRALLSFAFPPAIGKLRGIRDWKPAAFAVFAEELERVLTPTP